MLARLPLLFEESDLGDDLRDDLEMFYLGVRGSRPVKVDDNTGLSARILREVRPGEGGDSEQRENVLRVH